MISFETSVRIERPVEKVFAFVSDPLLFPQWNSAVQTVHADSGAAGELVRRTRCTANYQLAKSRTTSRSSPARNPTSSASARLRDRRRSSTATDSPPTVSAHGAPRRQRRAAWCDSRARAARGARGPAGRRCEFRRSQTRTRGERDTIRVRVTAPPLVAPFAWKRKNSAAGTRSPGIAALHEKQLCRFAWKGVVGD